MLPWNYLSLGKFVSLTFSNSLIIHAEKTKEITTVKEVWICDLNYHKIWWTFALIFSKNYEWFEELYQTLERVFHPLRLDFSTTSLCLDIGWNTLPRVWCNISEAFMSASLHWRSLISLRGSKCTESTRILVSISVHREKGMIQEAIYHPIHSKKCV